MPEYLLILLILLIAAILIQRYYRLRLYQSTKHMVVFNILFMIIGTIWDQFAISRGHWFYGVHQVLGIYIGYMPIEDFAFGFIVTYFGLVLYKLIEKKFS